MKTFPQFALAIILLISSLAAAQVKITTTSVPNGTVQTPDLGSH